MHVSKIRKKRYIHIPPPCMKRLFDARYVGQIFSQYGSIAAICGGFKRHYCSLALAPAWSLICASLPSPSLFCIQFVKTCMCVWYICYVLNSICPLFLMRTGWKNSHRVLWSSCQIYDILIKRFAFKKNVFMLIDMLILFFLWERYFQCLFMSSITYKICVTGTKMVLQLACWTWQLKKK